MATITVRLPDDVQTRLDRRTKHRERSAYVIAAVVRALDDDDQVWNDERAWKRQPLTGPVPRPTRGLSKAEQVAPAGKR